MNIDEAKRLNDILDQLCECYRVDPLTESASKIYTAALSKYPVGRVAKAAMAHVKSADRGASFFPKPADLIRRIECANPEDAGLPSLEVAFQEACVQSGRALDHRRYTHAAIQHAAHKTGIATLRGATTAADIAFAKGLFAEHYRGACRAISSGESMPALPQSSGVVDKGNSPAPPGFFSDLISII